MASVYGINTENLPTREYRAAMCFIRKERKKMRSAKVVVADKDQDSEEIGHLELKTEFNPSE